MHARKRITTSTIDLPTHDHGHVIEDGTTDGPPPELVALALAAQAGCLECAEHHARQAARSGATRREVLEALGTALLLSRDHAVTWAPLADAALETHLQAGS